MHKRKQSILDQGGKNCYWHICGKFQDSNWFLFMILEHVSLRTKTGSKKSGAPHGQAVFTDRKWKCGIQIQVRCRGNLIAFFQSVGLLWLTKAQLLLLAKNKPFVIWVYCWISLIHHQWLHIGLLCWTQ
jgi:hypothetical protein